MGDEGDEVFLGVILLVVVFVVLAVVVVVSSVLNCPLSLIRFMQLLWCCTSGISSAFSCWCMDFSDADIVSISLPLSRLLSIFVADLWRFVVVTFFVLLISSIFFNLEICKEKTPNKRNCVISKKIDQFELDFY